MIKRAVACLLLVAIVFSVDAVAQEPSERSASSQGIAVVELFTSQGCSSCPPADAALRQIASVAQRSELPVYVLSFHVDYWNRLGWNDPYSRPEYSQRQRSYAVGFGSRRVYTPQMIVGGRSEFVGSDRRKAHQAIVESLKAKADVRVQIEVVESSRGALAVEYKVDDADPAWVLNLAAVHTPKPNAVPVGENAGATLSHVNVVRGFGQASLRQTEGRSTIELPAGVDPESITVIGYVQDPSSLQIVGAASS